MIINRWKVTNAEVMKERGAGSGRYKDNNIKNVGYDLDMEIYGIWLEALNICQLRNFRFPEEITDDFYYTHKGDE